jgi:hypothetical protein
MYSFTRTFYDDNVMFYEDNCTIYYDGSRRTLDVAITDGF